VTKLPEKGVSSKLETAEVFMCNPLASFITVASVTPLKALNVVFLVVLKGSRMSITPAAKLFAADVVAARFAKLKVDV